MRSSGGGRGGWIHVEVGFGRFPLVGSFREEGGEEAEEGGFVWKDAGDAGAAFEFLVDAFEGVAGAQAALVGGREGEDGEAFRDGGFKPEGEFWGGGGVGDEEYRQSALGTWAVRAVEDAADVGGNLGNHLQAGDVGLGALLEVELAALPWHGGKDGAACGGEAGVVVADEELEGAQAALSGGVAFERVEGEVAQKSEVFGSVTGAHAVLILGEGHIERPVQLVLDAPMAARRTGEFAGIGAKAAQEEAGFRGGLAVDLADAFDHADAAQALPQCAILQPADLLGDPVAARLDAPMFLVDDLPGDLFLRAHGVDGDDATR